MESEGQKQSQPEAGANGQAEQPVPKLKALANGQESGSVVLDHRQEMFGDYYNDPLGR